MYLSNFYFNFVTLIETVLILLEDLFHLFQLDKNLNNLVLILATVSFTLFYLDFFLFFT